MLQQPPTRSSIAMPGYLMRRLRTMYGAENVFGVFLGRECLALFQMSPNGYGPKCESHTTGHPSRTRLFASDGKHDSTMTLRVWGYKASPLGILIFHASPYCFAWTFVSLALESAVSAQRAELKLVTCASG